MSSGISSSPTRFERPAAACSSSRERPTPGRRITYKRLRVVFHESGLDQTGLVGEDDRLYAVAQVEFLEDAGDVGFRGSVADDEFGGDLGVREAAREPLEHFELAGGQPFELPREIVRPARLPPKFLDHGTRDRWVEERVAACDDAHPREQFLCGRVLEQEAACAGSKRFVDVVGETEGREGED